MKLRTTEYFVREVCISIKRSNWMPCASLSTVAVALFVLGVFLIPVFYVIVDRISRMLGISKKNKTRTADDYM